MNNPSSVFLDTLNKRQIGHARNPNLDSLIAELSEFLTPVQSIITESHGCPPQWPVGLVVGCPRSGTTLLMQWLASLGVFSYPTNLLTRFAYAPYLGILFQKMLFDTDFAHQDDFCDLRPQDFFSSSLGKCRGVLAPNEFFHFWRRFMPNFDLQYLAEEQLSVVDFSSMVLELGLIEKGLGRPFFTKGLIQQYNIKTFYDEIPHLFFLSLLRNPIHVMQSILIAREEFYGTRDLWWSVRPEEYIFLKDMDIYHQVAGQVYFTEQAIANGLKDIPQASQLAVEYELSALTQKTFIVKL